MFSRFVSRIPRSAVGIVRLFCIPYAGGSAAVFNNWDAKTPDWLQVCPIELPGRGALSLEALPTSVVALARAIALSIYPYTDIPYALFGHSMGALIAYEVACHVESKALKRLCKLLASGCQAPYLPRKKPPVSELPAPEFLERIREINGTPEEILMHDELMDIVLPILRADFALCEHYSLRNTHLLQAPITTLAGNQDEDISDLDMQGWGRLTTGNYSSLLFDGGHFFIKDKEDQVLKSICDELECYRAER
jgi:medium-chain acyl-[acyl-carrier-protein] hydrolase